MRTGATRGLRVTSLYLENWRNFTHVDVPLARRVFLVGPNASGKSNLLDVFRFLHEVVSVGGGFQEAVQKRGGVSRIRCLAARRYSDVALRASLGADDATPVWEYELRFKQDNRQRPLVARELVRHDGEVILQRPDEHDKDDPERLTQTYLEQVNANQGFRDVAEFFGSVRYHHLVPQLVRDPDRSVGRSHDPYGGDFLEQIAGAPERTRKARLQRIQHALKVAVPQLTELDLWRDDRGVPHLRGRYEHWRPQGAWQSEGDFSDGTLRLMGLLWALLDGAGPLLLEEPELSLHPGVVTYLPSMFYSIQRKAGRQVIVSTHSSELLLDQGIGLDEVLLLQPGSEGTSVHAAQDISEIPELLSGGVNLPDAVMPRTAPRAAEQLTLFGI
ncbi:MAG TPA: AAA family ATPase [Armatimonadota bacterium]|nr:AAA family ATPase [Armatimonadota bacterium]